MCWVAVGGFQITGKILIYVSIDLFLIWHIIQNNAEQNMVSFISLLAQRWILLSWKQKTAPAHSDLMNDVMDFLELENFKFSHKKLK